MSHEKLSIQRCYGSEFSHCFGCGQAHATGLHLESFMQADGSALMTTTPPSIYTGGVPHNLYGGFISMLFDCHGTASAAGFYLNHIGQPLSPETLDRFVTAHLEVDFLCPTPMGCQVKLTAVPVEITERKVVLSMSLEAAGKDCARAKMVAVRFAPKGGKSKEPVEKGAK